MVINFNKPIARLEINVDPSYRECLANGRDNSDAIFKTVTYNFGINILLRIRGIRGNKYVNLLRALKNYSRSATIWMVYNNIFLWLSFHFAL